MDSSSTEHDTPPDAPIIIVTESTQETPKSTEQTPEPVANYQVHEKAQESPSPGQESPVVASSISKIIPYTLRITLEVSQDSRLVKDLSVLLHEQESYQKIEKEAEEHATTFFAQTIGERELKFSYGNCIVVSNHGNKTRLPLRSQEDWAVLYNSVVDYLISRSNERLHFCISRHYLACQAQPSEEESFAKLKSDEINDLMRHAWENVDYIPHNVLETIISDQTIYCIVNENPLEGVSQDEQDSFISRVQAEGRVLLAMCVHANLGTECLKVLLDRGWTDGGWKDSSLPPLDEKSYCHYKHRKDYKSLCKGQGSFRAAHFAQDEHKDLHSGIVVPLHFFPRADGNDNMTLEKADSYVTKTPDLNSGEIAADEKQTARCGSGAYSNVYCVKLDPNHHSLSKDLDTCFALKELQDRGKKSFDHFRRELKILQEIRRSNIAHIVTHLASWTQNGRHYLLFPLAQCNLLEYMQNNDFGIRKKNNIIWFLEQVHGIADAVKHIHNLTFQKTPASGPGLVAPASEDRKTAWHHDLKPENLLLFLDNRTGRGMIRISDWGSGKVSEYRHTSSYHTKSPNGTVTYEPPEADSDGGVSRPYDLWSLGCVYLVLLVWATFGRKEAERFSSDRGTTRGSTQTGSLRDDAFWKLDEKQKEKVLRSSVTVRMRRLDEDPSALPFKEFLECVRRMLEIDPNKRIKASELSERLRQIHEMKKAEMENDSETQPLLIQTDHTSPDRTSYGNSPLSARHADPAFAEYFNLSPSNMSPHTTRSQHSRNSSASELIPSNPTRSRQSSNASTHSDLSLRNRGGSHSSGNAPGSHSEGP